MTAMLKLVAFLQNISLCHSILLSQNWHASKMCNSYQFLVYMEIMFNCYTAKSELNSGKYFYGISCQPHRHIFTKVLTL